MKLIDHLFEDIDKALDFVLTEEELNSYYNMMPDEWNRICDCIHIPGDKDGKLKDALRNLPDDARYSWAFKKGIEHTINYNGGYLLKRYQSCLI